MEKVVTESKLVLFTNNFQKTRSSLC